MQINTTVSVIPQKGGKVKVIYERKNAGTSCHREGRKGKGRAKKGKIILPCLSHYEKIKKEHNTWRKEG